MKIVVLAGGTSTERDISIISGKGVCEALRAQGHRAILLDVFFGNAAVDLSDPFPTEYDTEAAAEQIRSKNPELEKEKKERRNFFGTNVLELCMAADLVFMALHGSNGEDGKVQATFDLMGIRYTGTGHLSSALAMDKGMTKMVFQANGVPTPKGFSAWKGQAIKSLTDYGLNFPVVVKPCCGGSSVGVMIAENEEMFRKALENSFSYEDEAVIEEFIKGREFSVAVIDGEAYPVIEIAPKEGFYDFKNKYSAGSTIETCPAQITKEQTERMQEEAVHGAGALGITGYCRLDFIMTEDGEMYVLEANTLPGMTPTSLIPQEAAVLGISYPELCEKLIQISMRKYEA
jgi:D-alanine-D-alanine ligase